MKRDTGEHANFEEHNDRSTEQNYCWGPLQHVRIQGNLGTLI
jgi:hypothetical protein